MRRIIIYGLRLEFRSFIVAIQGCPKQLSLVNLENLLADQKALTRQMLETIGLKKSQHKAI